MSLLSQHALGLWVLAPQAQTRFTCVPHSYSDLNLEELFEDLTNDELQLPLVEQSVWVPFVREAYVFHYLLSHILVEVWSDWFGFLNVTAPPFPLLSLSSQAAWGGGLLMSRKHRHKLSGIER